MFFLLPAIASVVLFVLLWRGGLLARPGLVAAGCAGGVCLQFLSSMFSPMWVAGLLVNVGMAVYLSLRLKMS